MMEPPPRRRQFLVPHTRRDVRGWRRAAGNLCRQGVSLPELLSSERITLSSGTRNCLVVVAHPYTGRSLNHRLANAASSAFTALGFDVRMVDLYAISWTDGRGGIDDFTAPVWVEPDDFQCELEQNRAATTGGFSPEVAEQIASVERADVISWWAGCTGARRHPPSVPTTTACLPPGSSTGPTRLRPRQPGGQGVAELGHVRRRLPGHRARRDARRGRVHGSLHTPPSTPNCITPFPSHPIPHDAAEFMGARPLPTFSCTGADTPPGLRRDAKRSQCASALAGYISRHIG